MPLAAPQLDDRKFQDIVDELKKRIPRYCPEWTDHNVSDPGVTLIELFSHVAEQMLYRMNQVPRLHYIRMMELLGIKLQGPQAAEVPVTFWFSAPFTNEEQITAGTQLSTTQTETKAPVVFATKDDFTIYEPQSNLKAIYTGTKNTDWNQNDENSQPFIYEKQQNGQTIVAFSTTPQGGDALYFGFDKDFSGYILRFEMEVDTNATDGIRPQNPPWAWEATTGSESAPWEKCAVESAHNTLGGMSRNGSIQTILPKKMGRMRIEDESLYWVRVCVDHSKPEADTGRYKKPPRIYKIEVATLGCTIDAIHSGVIKDEILGVSDGTPGQRFILESTPVLPRLSDEHLKVFVGGQSAEHAWGNWQEVRHFGDSSATDYHYMLDGITGELRLGPAIQQRDGEISQFGAVPPPGARLIMSGYRYGGGIIGNVKAGEINTLKTSIPYVSRVRNRMPSAGGLDAQSLDDAVLKVPQHLRTRNRAVTMEDFEYISLEKCGSIFGRVKCLPPTIEQIGQDEDDEQRTRRTYIDLRVIPQAVNRESPLPEEIDPTPQELEPKKVLLQAQLDQHRLLTTRIQISLPTYVWVSIDVQANRMPGVSTTTIEDFILRRLYRFLNPLIGGFDGKGWPFGKELHKSEVHQYLIQPDEQLERMFTGLNLERVEYMIPYRNVTMLYRGKKTNEIELTPDGVIASDRHTVIIL